MENTNKNEQQTQPAKKPSLLQNIILWLGIILCVGGSVLMDTDMGDVAMVMCLVGIPVAVVGIIMSIKNNPKKKN